MRTPTARLPLRGPYDLREVALMGFGHRDEGSFDGVMRLGFCVDGDCESQVGVAVRQDGDDLSVGIEQHDGPPADPAAVVRQAARVVSADHDGQAYADLCLADPVLAPIFARAPGFRPANFYSPYEAAICGLTDALATEPQVLKHLEATYGRSVDAAELEHLAEAWRPWRTWVTVMLRALGGRTDAEDAHAGG